MFQLTRDHYNYFLCDILKKINPMINIPNTHKAINAIKRLAIVLVK